jgi:hypothetical protein
MNQPGYTLDPSLRIAKPASQLSWVGGLLFNDRLDDSRHRFHLVALRPRQQFSDMLGQTSSGRFFVRHKTSLPQVNHLLLLVNFQNVS